MDKIKVKIKTQCVVGKEVLKVGKPADLSVVDAKHLCRIGFAEPVEAKKPAAKKPTGKEDDAES